MAKAAPYEWPPDPEFASLAEAAWVAWNRDQPSVLAFDTETTGLQFLDEPFCCTVAWLNAENKLEAHYLELGVDLPGRSWPDGRQATTNDVVRWMLANTPRLVGHNIKFDIQKLELVGLMERITDPGRIEDTQALAHLDDEHRPKGLKPLAVSVLGYDDNIEVEYTSGPKKGETRLVPREKHEMDAVRRKLKLTLDDGFQSLPRAVILPYAVKDAEFTLGLYEKLSPRVEKYEDLSALYDQEMELLLVFLDMEHQGLGVDLGYVAEQVKVYTEHVLADEQRIAAITGRDVLSAIIPSSLTAKEQKEAIEAGSLFNPASNPQLASFFVAAGFISESYDAKYLGTIDHPLAPALLELRTHLKILGTYFRALQRETTADGIFHPSFRQHGTVTGRTSSGTAQA